MASKDEQRSISVYAHWLGLEGPIRMGTLFSTRTRGKEIFSFEYDDAWLKKGKAQNLDPDLMLFSGPQYLNDGKNNFGIFLDSSPDRWGRVLMDRREALTARLEGRKSISLFETDYLLGVYDGHRMGALRFKEQDDGPFLNNNHEMASPPWTSIRELEQASLQLEGEEGTDRQRLKWINMLITPGSSLGGARPKASVLDSKKQLWIAKFPSTKDGHDIGAWEKVVHDLAKNIGLNVPETKATAFYSKQHTFLSKRFDRTEGGERIHFASAMTLLGHTDGSDHSSGVSYLDLAEFIIKNGASVDQDLEELWRRIVFYIAVSNTDDHLRNHGFLLTDKGWTISPAYDINPVEKGTGLSLNISEKDNALDFDLALSVGSYFRVEKTKAEKIVKIVKDKVGKWNKVAEKYGISRNERELMANAFRY
jgi:serine/threonine-protein kinase HipA